jgi:hypothetical protein
MRVERQKEWAAPIRSSSSKPRPTGAR